MSAHIRVWHDMNDRDRHGNYVVYLRAGTPVTVFDGDDKDTGTLAYDQFVTVTRAASVLANPQERDQ